MKTQYSSSDLVTNMSIFRVKNYCVRIARLGMSLSVTFNRRQRFKVKNNDYLDNKLLLMIL